MSVNTTVAAAKWAKTLASIKINAFLILGGLFVFTTAYFYYSVLNKPSAGVLWFVGGSVILYYYYVKWFLGPPEIDPDFMAGTYACPDYLSVIPPGTVDPKTGRKLYTPATTTQYYCVDFVGVSTNGGLKQTTPRTLTEDIKNPAYYFPVDAIRDFKAPTLDTKGNIIANGRGEFLQRLGKAGLSYNSMGEKSTPRGGMNTNGSPSFSGGQAFVNATPGSPGGLMGASASSAAPFTMTGDQMVTSMLETVSWVKANNINMTNPTGLTAAQKQAVMANLVSKRIVPAGVTYEQMEEASKKVIPTQEQIAKIMAASASMMGGAGGGMAGGPGGGMGGGMGGGPGGGMAGGPGGGMASGMGGRPPMM